MERPQKRERTALEKKKKRKFIAEENRKNQKEGPKNPKNETPSPDSHILYAGEDSDQGSQGSKPLPESWVTINVEGKLVGFMVDLGAQYSVLNQRDGPMSKKSSWVQGATGTKRYGWTDCKTASELGGAPGDPFFSGDT